MTAVNLNRAIRGPVTAVPIVAGTGVRFVADTQNNRVVAEIDETVLWDGNGTGTDGNITLSEAFTNFERIGIYCASTEAFATGTYNYGGKWVYFEAADLSATGKFNISDININASAANTMVIRTQNYSVASPFTELTYVSSCQMYYNGSSWANSTNGKMNVYKVVGINRKPVA